jgi:hypothetical protein
VIDDPCLHAIAIAWQSELVKQESRNSTHRKEGTLKNSVMLSGDWKVGNSSLPSRLRTADSRFGSVVKAEHKVSPISM